MHSSIEKLQLRHTHENTDTIKTKVNYKEKLSNGFTLVF